MVGTVESIKLLSAEQINEIHWAVVRDFAHSADPVDPPGIRDVDLFQAAVARPATAFAGQPKYPTVSLAAAALFHSIILNHPFHNGNKRTALVSLVTFLSEHGYVLTTEQDDLYDYVLRIADHKIVTDHKRDTYYADREMLAIARWLQREARRAERGERPLQYRRLKSILNEHGCQFEVLQGNRLNIRRGDLHTQVWYGGDGRDANERIVHKIRGDLELDEVHGFDSAVFYRGEERIPDFITKYRGLLERLAKV
jgi:death-on-curing family protein